MVHLTGQMKIGWLFHPHYLKNVGGTCTHSSSHGLARAWSEVKDECMPEDYLQIQEKVLWNNKNVTIAGKSIYYLRLACRRDR